MDDGVRVPVYADGQVIAYVVVPQALADALDERDARLEVDTTPILGDDLSAFSLAQP